MMKLCIWNMEEFLKVVNECKGTVTVIYPDGHGENIKNRSDIQMELRKRHRENKNNLTITLNAPNYRDYLELVNFTIRDY